MLDIVHWILNTGYFHIDSQVFKQIQGVTTGNPAAPVLCALAIIPAEVAWYAHSKQTSITIPTRRVDNLLGISSSLSWKGWHSSFYASPIELEEVSELNKFLGFSFSIVSNQFHISYDPVNEDWKYASSISAGSITRQLSGLVGVSHLIHRHCTPHVNKQKAIHALMEKYMEKGFTSVQLNEQIKSLNIKIRIDC